MLSSRTKVLMNELYSDEILTSFVNHKPFDIQDSSNKRYQLKSEYVIVYLLQNYMDIPNENKPKYHDNFVFGLYQQYQLKAIQLELNISDSKLIKEKINEIQLKFNEWMNLIHFMSVFVNEKTPGFYNKMSFIINNVIESLSLIIDGDQSIDRLKPTPKPRYSMPTQTLFVKLFYN